MDSRQSNSTSQTLPTYSGFLFLIGSSFFYGSNYIPVKQFETGDGMFFQLILCIGIWTVGFIVNCIRNFPKFYPLPLLGGFLWAVGNANTVLIIQTIGLGLGMIFWCIIGLICGWATARFGWFGLKAEVPSSAVLNYIGVGLACLGTVLYFFVKPETNNNKTNNSKKITPEKPIEIIPVNEISLNGSTHLIEEKKELSFFERMDPTKKRILGTILAIFSGVMYGESNTPILYTSERSDTSENYLDYLFSYYTGILITSLGMFLIYSAIMKNKPKLYPEIILPGIISGWMWGCANVCYFLATNALNQAVSYPIASSGPPIVASLWGVFLYKEIKGIKNFAFLLSGFAVAIVGAVLTGLSF